MGSRADRCAASRKKREDWKAAFDAALPLEGQLPRPCMRAWHVAHVMGIAESTVYDSMRRFDAAVRRGDDDAAAREVPSIILGNSYRVPTAAFVRWWTAGGTRAAYLAELAS